MPNEEIILKYFVINKLTGEVLKISVEPIVSDDPNIIIAKGTQFEEGDELNYYIVATVSEDGYLESYSAIRQSSFLKEAVLKNEVLDQMLFETNTELLQTQLEKDAIGQELLSLQTELIQKGVL